MKTIFKLTTAMLVMLSVSCKQTPTEERIEKNHPSEDNMEIYDATDTTTVIKDSVIDYNMKDQDDTHGRDVNKGK